MESVASFSSNSRTRSSKEFVYICCGFMTADSEELELSVKTSGGWTIRSLSSILVGDESIS
jgi:hypothetical protein